MRLSPQQRIIAWRLALQPFVSREELSEALWGWEDGPSDERNNIDVHICRLRMILPVELRTFWGRGYFVDGQQRPVLLDILAREIADGCYEPLTSHQHFQTAA